MSRRRRWKIARNIAGVFAALLAVFALLVILSLQSNWLRNKVRERMVRAVETATGGRAEIGAFHFDWRRLRVEVSDFTLHGTEPAGKPPLLRVAKAAVVLKIVSLWKRDIDIQSLDVATPLVYLIVAPDGSTNLPKPKTASRDTTMQTLLKLAIGRFALWNGVFEVESHGRTPFEARGQNLSAKLEYDSSTPRYHGLISVDPLEARVNGIERVPWAVSAAVSAERDRIAIESAKIATRGIELQLAGDVRNLADPRVNVKYTLRADALAAQKLFLLKLVDRGTVQLAGNAAWAGAVDYAVSGALHAYNFDVRSGTTRIANARGDGSLVANPKQLELRSLRYSGTANGVAVAGRVETAALLRGRDLDLRGVLAGALGGVFKGNARLNDFDRFTASGAISGVDIRRAVAIYSPEPLPWDGSVSGTVKLDASLNHANDLNVTATLNVAPAAQGPPVHGTIAGTYNAAAGTLDLGNSTLSLPNSRADFSGVLGRELRVHLETRDLNDFLPALGQNAGAIPVKLHNGSAIFDGTASGKLDSLHATGRLTATHLLYNDETLDSFTADMAASSNGIQLQNATAVRGPLRAELRFDAALANWKADPAGAISGAATLRNAAISDLVAALKINTPKPGSFPVKGTVDLTGQVSGTFGNPQALADLAVTKGSIEDEPFDRFVGRLAYSGGNLNLSSGELDAPGKRLTLTASYEPSPGRFDTGRLRFQLASNPMSLQQIQTVQKERPGAQGTLQLEATGTVDLAPPSAGRPGYRIEDLHANISALGLRLGQQPFGDIHLTANSQSGMLHAHLVSNFANSAIEGDGQWQLTGDYPGSATVNFSKLDFAQLDSWLSAGHRTSEGTLAFTGSAEGSLRIGGNALKPATLTADLTIPKFQIAPANNPAPLTAPFVLTNSAPIVAHLANSTITVESAHLTGPSTDVSLTGKATLQPKLAFDLRAGGRIDLGLLQKLNKDFAATGALIVDATIRGDFSSPQVNGRLQFDSATFNVADFPNGISKATGSLIFSGNRATIQEFSGETGGGKIQLTGFVTYANGEGVFRLHASVKQVRVRKPEGVSTVADADLSLSGTTRRSLLSGTISIQRMTFNPQSDFGSVIASSAQPAALPSAQTGFLAGLGLDVQISSAPDIEVQSTLTQDVQVEANLRLRGTVTNPALVGRINIIQGQLTFFGTKYTVSDGSISFFNPTRIAPVLDIDLTTKAQGIEITLTISGPLDHLTLTPSSDSALNYNDIISLLVTGRPPTSDPALLSGQNALGAGSFQQLGASALLGQAISAPVTGRLQRFFGVSSLRIDPTIPGIDANPAARLTLQQQVTPDVTFTYITSVTTTNPQIVQVEWALSSIWSVVAVREENGLTGVDFFFKKKF
jgi:translocation and assembly module TamB